MLAIEKPRMTVEEFLVWGEAQPERWELFDGNPVAMAPERLVHGRTKFQAARAFSDAIARANLHCEAVLDSAGVRVDAISSYQPDVMVYCGEALPGNDRLVDDPVIVVEVLSPSNALKDLRDKFIGYFKVPSIMHYLIIDPDRPMVIHHRRAEGDSISTRILSSGELRLDPPSLILDVADLLPVPEDGAGVEQPVT